MKAESEGRARFAATLHFTLGEPVIDHTGAKFSDRPFAFIFPSKYLKGQLLNVMPQDTFILGDFKLPKGAVVFLPKGTSRPPHLPFKFIEYDVAQDLRQVVRDYISSSALIALEAKGAADYSKVLFQGQDVNSAQHFSDLINHKRHISFGTHFKTAWGQIDLLTYKILRSYFYAKSRDEKSWRELQYTLRRIEFFLEKIQDDVEAGDFPDQAKVSLKRNVSSHARLLNLVRAELSLIKRHGRSFFAAPNIRREQILALMGDLPALTSLLDNHASEFPKTDDYIQNGFDVFSLRVWDVWSDLRIFDTQRRDRLLDVLVQDGVVRKDWLDEIKEIERKQRERDVTL